MAMNDFNIGFIGGLDGTKSKAKLNQDIDAIKKTLKELELKAKLDPNQVKSLETQLNTLKVNLTDAKFSQSALDGMVSQINNALKGIKIPSVNVGGNSNIGQQIGNNIAQGVAGGVAKATSAMKSFSQLTDSMKSQKVLFDGSGLIDEKNTLNEIKKIYSEFGQVKITNKVFDSGELQSFKVNIEQVNGELKETRTFMMQLSENGKFFVFPDDVVKGTEKYVQHLNAAKNATNATGEALNAQNQRLAEQAKYYGKIKEETNHLYSLKQKLLSADELQTAELNKQIKSTKQRITYNNQQLDKKGLRDNSLEREINDLVVAREKQLALSDAKAQDTANTKAQAQAQREANAVLKEQQALQGKVNKIQHSWSDGSYEAKYDSLIAKTRQWVDANDESVISTQKLTTAYNEFNTAVSNFAKDGSVKNRDILIQKEEELGRQLKATTNDIKVQNAECAKSSKVDSLHQKIQEFYDKNSATHRQWGGQLQNLLNETAHGAQVTATRVNEIEQEFLGVSNAARQAGKLGQSFFGGMIEQAKKFANWVSVTTLLMRGFQELKQGVQFIKELDDALTDVAYTSNSSKSQLENLGNSAIKMSKDLKASADNILEAVKIYSTAKSSADDILRKAQPAIMLSNISGMSGSESSKTINTALNQFELEDTEEGLLDITDTLQYVSSQLNYDFTEGIQQITEGLEASGSVAMNAGLSFQEYSAMVGLAVEKTGQAGSTIGQAYKTIFSRITKASATEGTLDEDISAAEKSLRSVGIQVRDSANEFRDLTDIMADLGKVWNSLSSVEKSNIGYNIAGIRQLNILNSLFGSWEDYASIMDDIDERTGTTLKNQEVYAESLAGHLGELEAVGQSVWNNIIQSETLKSGIDLLTGLLNIVDKTTDALGGLGTVGLAGGLLAGIKNVGQAKMWACLIYAYPC